MYARPDVVRKRLYALLLAPSVLGAVEAAAREAAAAFAGGGGSGGGGPLQRARGRDTPPVLHNGLAVLFAAATDLLGLPRVRAPEEEAIHNTERVCVRE
jgi:hypothetical protein